MTPIDKITRLRELFNGEDEQAFDEAARNSLPALLDVAEAALRMSCCDYDCGEDCLECNLARALARLAEGQ